MIFAGGRGVRMGSGIPKQFLEIHGKPVLVHTLELFQEHDMIDKIYISVLEDYIGKTQKLVDRYGLDKVVSIIPGGATAQDSIYNVLKDAEKENDGDSIVLLHDGVRPFVSYDTIKQNIESVQKYGSAITCTACYETILLSKSGEKVDSVPYLHICCRLPHLPRLRCRHTSQVCWSAGTIHGQSSVRLSSRK